MARFRAIARAIAAAKGQGVKPNTTQYSKSGQGYRWVSNYGIYRPYRLPSGGQGYSTGAGGARGTTLEKPTPSLPSGATDFDLMDIIDESTKGYRRQIPIWTIPRIIKSIVAMQQMYHTRSRLPGEPYARGEPKLTSPMIKEILDAAFGFVPTFRPSRLGDVRHIGQPLPRHPTSFWENVRDRALWRMVPRTPYIRLRPDQPRQGGDQQPFIKGCKHYDHVSNTWIPCEKTRRSSKTLRFSKTRRKNYTPYRHRSKNFGRRHYRNYRTYRSKRFTDNYYRKRIWY